MNEWRFWDQWVASAHRGLQWALENHDQHLVNAYVRYLDVLVSLRDMEAPNERLQL